MHFSSVLLPLPLRPTMPKNSPWRTSNETSLQRSEDAVAAAAHRVQRPLLERVHLLLGNAERLRDAGHANRRAAGSSVFGHGGRVSAVTAKARLNGGVAS